MALHLRRSLIISTGILVIVSIVTSVFLWRISPQIAEEEIRQIIVTTIQKEAAASFFITGYLDITSAITVENTKYFLPDLLDLNLGTTRSTVRVPGRVSYGFDATDLRGESIEVSSESMVDVVLPELKVYSVEPDLERMEVQTSVGWARLQTSSGRRVEQRAIRLIREALEKQAKEHLERSVQPRVNTAEALTKLLTPILQSAGIEEPRFRIQVGENLIMDPEG